MMEPFMEEKRKITHLINTFMDLLEYEERKKMLTVEQTERKTRSCDKKISVRL